MGPTAVAPEVGVLPPLGFSPDVLRVCFTSIALTLVGQPISHLLSLMTMPKTYKSVGVHRLGTLHSGTLLRVPQQQCEVALLVLCPMLSLFRLCCLFFV